MGKLNHCRLLVVLSALSVTAGCADDVVVPLDVVRRSESLGDPLINAIVANQEEDVLLALQSGSDANQQADETLPPLHIAAKHGHVEIGRLLIKHDADVNLASASTVTDEKGLSIQRRGTTPLHVAVANSQLEFAEMLVTEQKADVNAMDGLRQTPLDIAIGKGVDLDKLLTTPLDAPADLETQIPKNQEIQAMLRKNDGKTTADIEREKFEQDIASHKGESFLTKSTQRLERSRSNAGRNDEDDDPANDLPRIPDAADRKPSAFPGLEPLEPLDVDDTTDEDSTEEVGGNDESEE